MKNKGEQPSQAAQSDEGEQETHDEAAPAHQDSTTNLAGQLAALSFDDPHGKSEAPDPSDSAPPPSQSALPSGSLTSTLAELKHVDDWGIHETHVTELFETYAQMQLVIKSIGNLLLMGHKYKTSKPEMSRLLFDHAEHLQKMTRSGTAAVAAEVEVFASKFAKVETGRIELLEISEQGTDAYYLQYKASGVYVRQEVKSVTVTNGGELRAMIDAEVQHQVRLGVEEDKPTWHKTTLVINNADNTWPLSAKEKEACEGIKPEDIQTMLMSAALKKVTPLLFGSNKPRKEMGSSYARLRPEIVEQLNGAHTAQWEMGEDICEAAQVDKSILKSNSAYKETQYTDGEGADAPKRDSYRRCLLVTERIRIVNSKEGWIIALDRVEHGFVASMKMYAGKALPKTETKHPRRHWDIQGEAGYRSKRLPLKNGDTPFHIAARQGDMRAFRTMIEAHRDWLVELNDQERMPLHEAVLSGEVETVRFLLDAMDEVKFDEVDIEGNTLLHLAAQSNNLKVVEHILEAGKGEIRFELTNNAGKTVLDLAKHSPEISAMVSAAIDQAASSDRDFYLG